MNPQLASGTSMINVRLGQATRNLAALNNTSFNSGLGKNTLSYTK
jgi:hypothetical protein